MKFLIIVSMILFSACSKKDIAEEKVLKLYSMVKLRGLDPANCSGVYEAREIGKVYEGLLEYHYLKKPYELIPNLAEAMPQVSNDGLTYTFKILKGVFFQDDAAFANAKGREMTAHDFVYSFKRVADPNLQGLGWWTLDGKLKGLNEWRQKYTGKAANYDDAIEGLLALDNHTLQFTLNKAFPQFLYVLAMANTFVVAREVVKKYGEDFTNHPVGTGPYRLVSYQQGSKLIYEKNPTYRKKYYPKEASAEFEQMGFLKDAGKELPLVSKVEVSIITEEHPRWLNFKKGAIDYVEIPKDNFISAVREGTLSDELTSLGMKLIIQPTLDTTFMAFNFDNKILDNVNLRRAMSLALDPAEWNQLFYNSSAIPAQSVIPPGAKGYDETYRNPYHGPNLAKAKELLIQAGYPEGKGLPTMVFDTSSSTVYRQMGEYFKKRMALIGIDVSINSNPWPELQKKIDNRRFMIYTMAWQGDYPDGHNFLQLLYGPNRAPGPNGSGFNSPEVNALFEKVSLMSDSEERTKLYKELNQMIGEQVPWIFGVHRRMHYVAQGWVENYYYSDFDAAQIQYLNINSSKKAELSKKL
jgi:oligopeptide transport system substrate-binding protein